MNRKINNLEELLQEKARVQAQMKIVQEELKASAQRTRQEFRLLVEEKFSLSKQLGQMFQGSAKPGMGTAALQAVGQVAGRGTWWGGIAATLLPMVVDFIRRQVARRKERKAAKPAKPALESGTNAAAPEKPKSRGRRLFKRKKKADEGDTPE